jgi:hypothetical protein
MNVRRAIELLQQLPPDAEVMIDAPFACSKGAAVADTASLRIPVRSLRSGIFYYPNPPGSQWACFMGTGAWGLDQGLEADGEWREGARK